MKEVRFAMTSRSKSSSTHRTLSSATPIDIDSYDGLTMTRAPRLGRRPPIQPSAVSIQLRGTLTPAWSSTAFVWNLWQANEHECGPELRTGSPMRLQKAESTRWAARTRPSLGGGEDNASSFAITRGTIENGPKEGPLIKVRSHRQAELLQGANDSVGLNLAVILREFVYPGRTNVAHRTVVQVGDEQNREIARDARVLSARARRRPRSRGSDGSLHSEQASRSVCNIESIQTPHLLEISVTVSVLANLLTSTTSRKGRGMLT